MKIDKESDTLKKEYKGICNEIEQLTRSRKYSPEYIMSKMNQMLQRQEEIVKEIENCTGIQITAKTLEVILEENRRIQQYGSENIDWSKQV
jgi:hypothetical protein